MAHFGDKLREERVKKKLTQQDLAECVGCTQTAIAKFETNAIAPNVYIAYKLAQKLEISLDEMMRA